MIDADLVPQRSCSLGLRAMRARNAVLALIEHPHAARRILRHLGMRDHAPPIAPARIPDTTFDDVA